MIIKGVLMPENNGTLSTELHPRGWFLSDNEIKKLREIIEDIQVERSASCDKGCEDFSCIDCCPHTEIYGTLCRNMRDFINATEEDSKKKPDIVHIEAEVPYAEDAYINGVEENESTPHMPFLTPSDKNAYQEWIWKIDINIETGEVMGFPKDIKASIKYKVCDCCTIKYNNQIVTDYVPEFLALDDDGFGDYIYLTIENGMIKDWDSELCRKNLKSLYLTED